MRCQKYQDLHSKHKRPCVKHNFPNLICECLRSIWDTHYFTNINIPKNRNFNILPNSKFKRPYNFNMNTILRSEIIGRTDLIYPVLCMLPKLFF